MGSRRWGRISDTLTVVLGLLDSSACLMIVCARADMGLLVRWPWEQSRRFPFVFPFSCARTNVADSCELGEGDP